MREKRKRMTDSCKIWPSKRIQTEKEERLV